MGAVAGAVAGSVTLIDARHKMCRDDSLIIKPRP